VQDHVHPGETAGGGVLVLPVTAVPASSSMPPRNSSQLELARATFASGQFQAAPVGIAEYPFPHDPSADGYCIFPRALEDDELVFFHATPAANLNVIKDQGFKIPDPAAIVGLASVSFAKRSIGALHHAMERRRHCPGDYSIIAVRYKKLRRPGLQENITDIHDFTLDPPPEIIGFCTVPAAYRHM
jgi:hypothetical protein